MNNEEIIQALKDNKEAFGLMSAEMQDKAEKIGKYDNFQWYNDEDWEFTQNHGFTDNYTYRLRPDYEEKPSVVKIPIYPMPDDEGGRLAYDVEGLWELVADAISYPDFIGFLYEDGTISAVPRKYADSLNSWISVLKLEENHEVLIPTHVLFRGK